MRIVDIRTDTVPAGSAMRNAAIDFSQMTVSVVALASDVRREGKPLVGYGFHSVGRYAPHSLLQDRLIPRLLQAPPEALLAEAGDNFDPFKTWGVLMQNEKPGGHGDRAAAVGALDMALWDLAAKIEARPLYRLLADRCRGGQAEPEVFVYAAGGYYYPGKDDTALQDEMRGYLDQGYTAVKMKIGGAPLADDLRRIEAALKVVGSGSALAVDANGRFDLPTALRYAEALAPYGLLWYEEPGDPLDYQLNAEVAQASPTPIATGENLFSLPDARNLIRYGGLRPDRDFLQFDPALAYGLVEYIRILRMLSDSGWSWRRCVPHGGNQLTLHLAAGLGLGANESYPNIFQPFGGFGVPIVAGRARPPEAPGLGIELRPELLAVFSRLF